MEKYLELRTIYNGYLAGEDEDLDLLTPYFPYDWCLVDEDGYELNLSHGKGLFAITFIHRKKKMIAFELIDPIQPEKEISEFIKVIEESTDTSLWEYFPRIIDELKEVKLVQEVGD